MRLTEVKGQCLQCGRQTAKQKPVLRYRYVKKDDYHMLKCTICATIFTATTKEDVMRQLYNYGP